MAGGELRTALEKLGSGSPKEQLEALNDAAKESRKAKCSEEDAQLSVKKLRPYLASNSSTLRTAALKTAIFTFASLKTATVIGTSTCDIFIIRSMESGAKKTDERLHAFRVFNVLLKNTPTDSIPRSFISSLVAIASAKGDDQRTLALRLLCEIVIRDPAIAATADAVRVLAVCALDEDLKNMQSHICSIFVHLISSAKLQSLVPKSRMETLIAPIANVHLGKGSTVANSALWHSSLNVVISLMRSYAGLHYLCNLKVPRLLVDTLLSPFQELHAPILLALYALFDLDEGQSEILSATDKSSASSSAAAAAPQITVNGEAPPLPPGPFLSPRGEKKKTSGGVTKPEKLFDISHSPFLRDNPPPNLLDGYKAILLSVFLQAGLVKALVQFAAEGGEAERKGGNLERESYREAAAVLLAELLALSSRLLSPESCAPLYALPELIGNAAKGGGKSRAAAVILALSQYSQRAATSALYEELDRAVALAGSSRLLRVPGEHDRLDRVDDVKRRIESVDPSTLLLRLAKCHVVETKDFKRWDWPLILELLEGPLTVGSNVSVALRGSPKWNKRIMSFATPGGACGDFASLPLDKNGKSYARAVRLVLEALLSASEGSRDFLKGHKLFPRLADLLTTELERADGKGSLRGRGDEEYVRYLEEDSLKTTTASEYFTFMGVLSGNRKGIEVLRKNNLWHLLKKLIEMEGRDDITRLILSRMDYTVAPEAAELLAVGLKKKSPQLRSLALTHVSQALRAKAPNFSIWGVNLLLTRLKDDTASEEERKCCVKILDEALCNREIVQHVLSERSQTDALLELGSFASCLLYRLLSVAEGVMFMKKGAKLLPLWMEETEFMKHMSTHTTTVGQEFLFMFQRGSEAMYLRRSVGVAFPAHLLAELSSTEVGYSVISSTSHIGQLVKQVSSDSPQLARTAVFALGSAIAHVIGAKALSSLKIVELLANTCLEAPSLSVRGAAFYALCNVCCSSRGGGFAEAAVLNRTALAQLGWLCATDSKAAACVPPCTVERGEIGALIESESESWAEKLPASPFLDSFQKRSDGESSNARDEILRLLVGMGNRIVRDKSLQSLLRLKSKEPASFVSPLIFVQGCSLLSNYFYTLAQRQDIYKLFNSVQFDDEFFAQVDSGLEELLLKKM